jgi:hypothetical protein
MSCVVETPAKKDALMKPEELVSPLSFSRNYIILALNFLNRMELDA